MTRHSLRWDSLAFGALFLAVAGNWAVWKQDLLTARQLSLSASGVLILLGLIGVAATVARSRSPRTTPDPTTTEGTENEEADPQH